MPKIILKQAGYVLLACLFQSKKTFTFINNFVSVSEQSSTKISLCQDCRYANWFYISKVNAHAAAKMLMACLNLFFFDTHVYYKMFLSNLQELYSFILLLYTEMVTVHSHFKIVTVLYQNTTFLTLCITIFVSPT